jgi:hypothetical protein
VLLVSQRTVASSDSIVAMLENAKLAVNYLRTTLKEYE